VGSKSPFGHEEDHNRHVKPDRGGRMILSGDGLRLIKAKSNKIETAIEKLRNKLLGAQMRLEREEKRAHEKEQRRPRNDERSQRRKLTGHGKLRRSRWDDNRLSYHSSGQEA